MLKVQQQGKNVYFLFNSHKLLKKQGLLDMNSKHTHIHKKQMFLFFIFLLSYCLFSLSSPILIFATKTEQSEEKTTSLQDNDLYAKSALLMDASTGRVLYEKDGYHVMPMASTTKIMTCIYALENGNLDDVVTISSTAAAQPKVRLGVKKDQQYTLRDLLYSLMLESHNDCAVAIAEHISGSVDQFCYEMSNKARDLGAYDTNFETPNGLDSDNHHTTAYDLALITKYAIQNEEFISIINTSSHTFQEITKGTTHTVHNKDAFLNQYSGAFGVKTGFTGKAGYCFVGAVKQDQKTFISVVLASGWPPNKTWKWSDTKKLMNYGVNNYSLQEIGIENPHLEQLKVIDGQQATVSLYTDVQREQLLLSPSEKIDIKINLPDHITAPVIKDMPIGSISYYLNGEELSCYSIYTKESIKKIDYSYCFRNIFIHWIKGVPIFSV